METGDLSLPKPNTGDRILDSVLLPKRFPQLSSDPRKPTLHYRARGTEIIFPRCIGAAELSRRRPGSSLEARGQPVSRRVCGEGERLGEGPAPSAQRDFSLRAALRLRGPDARGGGGDAEGAAAAVPGESRRRGGGAQRRRRRREA